MPLECPPESEDEDLYDDLFDWGVVMPTQLGPSNIHEIDMDTMNDDGDSIMSTSELLLSASCEEPVQLRSSDDQHVLANHMDQSLLSVDELAEMEEHQWSESRALRMALLIRDRDRQKLVWELGNKALARVETLMRMMKMDQAAEQL